MIKLKPIILLKVHFIVALIFSGLQAVPALPAETGSSVVRAVFFFSPTCPHCTQVKEEVLPPLIAQYGSKLQLATVNTTTESGNTLFLAASMKYGNIRLSVPMIVVGNTAMIGSDDIPQRFPGLIEKHLAAGGIGWPKIEGLSVMLASKSSDNTLPGAQQGETAVAAAASSAGGLNLSSKDAGPAPASEKNKSAEPSKPVAAAMQKSAPVAAVPDHAPAPAVAKNAAVSAVPPPAAPAAPAAEASSSPAVQPASSGIIELTAGEAEMGIVARIRQDIYGNGLAILILIAMIAVLAASPWILKKVSAPATSDIRPRYDWLIPVLVLAGIGVAAYLSNVEVRHVEAVCGPVGDCNAVNQSKYASLFGILPIGVLGLSGFIAILMAWTLRRWGRETISCYAAVGILGMTAFGTLFSIYLTFLEPFVIGATCLWCLSSATIMTILFILALKPGRQAWMALGSRKGSSDGL